MSKRYNEDESETLTSSEILKRESYYSLDTESVTKSQQAIMECVSKYGPINRRRIGKILKKPISSITARVNELIKKGLLESLDAEWDPQTQRTVGLINIPETPTTK